MKFFAKAGLAICGLVAGLTVAQAESWQDVLAEADGQTVFWHAWGGSTATNDFIRWAGDELLERHGVRVNHVKLADTADAVARVLAEQAAGKDSGGAVDLIWINGANFASMKEAGLLHGPWAQDLPNWALVDVAGKPAVTSDFTVPTDGLESPWAMAQVVFYHDTARLERPPRSIAEIGQWAAANPGRFTYPQPPDFLGTTFLKQALIGLLPDPSVLQDAVEDSDYATVTAPLWAYLDDLHPNLWRAGLAFPQTGPRQLQLMADGEIDLAISFSPGEASAAIANGQLPETVRTFVLTGGTIGNASFVAIPYNANAMAGAKVLANFLLSAEAQARAQDPNVLGYGTVLDVASLPAGDKALFDALELGVATLTPEELGPALPEPHPSWAVRLAEEWDTRYGSGQ